MFRRVLIANRGEIACRIIRTLRRLDVGSVAVHSEAEPRAKHVREADAAVLVGPAPAPQSYLDAGAILRAAGESGADAVHPGYGFLSEDPSFARAVTAAGLAWVGSPPEVLELTGDKVAARSAFGDSGFPVLPGDGPLASSDEAVEAAASLGYPLMVKAVMGGGGIGMGVARDDRELRAAAETARTRAERFFGDPAIYLERFVPAARHVEIQVLADDERTLHLYERECSVQRRHQKVIEETPSPALDDELRERMCEQSIRAMEAIGYRGAGTVECILTPEREFYFLEVNARIQVEHPITEVTTGVDLVEQQLRIAAGEGMSLAETPSRQGHAIEFRVYAEDPETFLPSPGTIERLERDRSLGPPSFRFDFGYEEGDEVPMHYDPLIGKIILWASDRAEALKTATILRLLPIEGVKTNLKALLRVMKDDRFRSGAYDTGLLGK